MTEKDFLVTTLADEVPRFLRVIEAIPLDKLDYTPDPKSRTAGSLVGQLAVQPSVMVEILKTGAPKFDAHAMNEKPASMKALSDTCKKGFEDLIATLKATKPEVWESKAGMEGWETTRRDMVWGFFLDMVHHRGQISTYFRPMGAKVPAVYGPSGDNKG